MLISMRGRGQDDRQGVPKPVGGVGVTFPSPAVALRVSLQVLVTLYALTSANHASAGGLGDLLKAVESLDQSIQEKVQGVLGSTESTHQETSEEPDSETTATSVDSDRIRIKAEPRVANESVGIEEEDQDEPNVVSSEIIRLTPDAVLKEGPSGEAGTTEGGQSVMSGSSAGAEDNGQSEAAPQALNDPSSVEGAPEDDGSDIHWEGTANLVIRRLPQGPGSGEIAETYQIDVDWIEAHRIDVKTAQDELTGVLVILSDHASRWSGEVSGTIIERTWDTEPCAQWTYQGEGKGTKTLEYAWIYFSLSDEDPVKDVMPHGTYHVQGHHDEKPSGTMTYTSLCGRPSTSSGDGVFFGLKFLNLGREVWRPMPCVTPATCRSATFRSIVPWIPAEALKERLQRELPLANTASGRIDPQPRVVVDNAIRGSYSSNEFSPAIVDLSWEIKREVETSPILDNTAKNWRPEHENEANNLSITARVEKPSIPGKFRFTLFDVTREKGWAMNAGYEWDDSLDLEFMDGLDGFQSPKKTPDGNGWKIEANRTMTTATVKIKANDYGAWGKLKCEINVDGEWWPCKSEDGKDYVTIPHDEDENKIADFWEEQKGVSGDAAADDDEMPEGREPGDGFSNYEEYRGFKIKGEWTDTDPKEKDLFVHQRSNREEITSGIREFETKSGLTVHEINADELDRVSRIVNFNRGIKQAVSRNDQGQAGVIVVVRELDDTCGQATPHGRAGADLGGPNITLLVMVNPACLGLEHGTIVHELGHAVNLWHPGPRYSYQCGKHLAAGMGTPYAGPMNNYMRYNYARKYIGPDNRCYKYPSHLEVVPSAFVNSPEGTGMNAGPERWERNWIGEKKHPYPVSGDATCSGTLIDKSMSLNQDAKPAPAGC